MGDLITELMRFIRVNSQEGKEELEALIPSCKKELELAGVYGDETDPSYRQAIRLYCKAHYGYDDKTERFQEAYEALRDTMALSGNYKKNSEEET